MNRRSIVLASLVLLVASPARAEEVTGCVLQNPTGTGFVIWSDPGHVYPVLGAMEKEVGALRGRVVRVNGQLLLPRPGSRIRRTPIVVDRIIEQGPAGSQVERVRARVTWDEASGEHVLMTPRGPLHVRKQMRDGPLPDLAQFRGRTIEVQGLVRRRLAVTGPKDGRYASPATMRSEVIVERALSLAHRELAGTVALVGDDLVLEAAAGRVKLYSTPDDRTAPGTAPSALEDLLRRSIGAKVQVRGWALLGRDGRVLELMAGAVHARVDGAMFNIYQDGVAHRDLSDERFFRPMPPPARAESFASLDGGRPATPRANAGLVDALR